MALTSIEAVLLSYRDRRFTLQLFLVLLLFSTITVGGETARTVNAAEGASSGLFLPYTYYTKESYGTLYAHLDAITMNDFNGDGRRDIALVTSFQEDLYRITPDDAALFIFHQSPTGVLLPPVRYATAFTNRTRERSIASGDLNGDGRADIAIGNYDNLEIFTQTGIGTLEQKTVIRTPFGVSVKIGDVNSDGRNDIVSTGHGFPSTKLVVWPQSAQGSFGESQSYDANGSNGNEIEIGDLNGDGKKDVILRGGGTADILVYLQTSDGRLAAPATYDVDSQNCSGVAVGDVTGDGLDDVIVTFGGNRFNPPFPGVAVLAQNAGHTLNQPIKYDTLDVPQPAEVGDVNGDGKLDVIVVHYGWLKVGVYIQSNNGTLLPEELYDIPHNPNGHHPQGLAVGDINGDGQQDIAVTDNYQRKLLLLYHTTPGETPPSITITSPNGGESLTPGVVKEVTWTSSSSVDRVRIDYSIDGINFIPIVTDAPNTGSFPWTVPDTGSSRTLIRIFDASGRAWDENDGFFNIASCHATLTTIRDVFEPRATTLGFVVLSTGANCAWQATVDVPWLQINAHSSGTGNETIPFYIDGGSPPAVATFKVLDATLKITRAGNFTSVSAARFHNIVAPGSIVAGFGQKLAAGTESAATNPLPTSLLGTTVKVKDAYGVERLAPLFFVGPGQINYLMPPETAIGEAQVTVISGDGFISVDPVVVQAVAVGIFSAAADGTGPATGYIVKVKDGVQTEQQIARYDEAAKKWVAEDIDVSQPGETVVLVLFATGMRFRNPEIPVQLLVGVHPVTAQYAGPQGYFVGLDQINVILPPAAAGIGEVFLGFQVEGGHTNSVSIKLK